MNPQLRRIGPAALEAPVMSLVEMREQPRAAEPSTWARLWELVSGRGMAVALLVLAAALAVAGALVRYDRWKTEVGVRREVLEQFLVYENLVQDEYDVAYPLAAGAQQELTFERYKQAIDALNAVKRERQRAFAQLQARVVSLRAFPEGSAPGLEEPLSQVDDRATEVHGDLENWIRDTYCMHADCENSQHKVHDLAFPQFNELMRIRKKIREFHTKDSQVVQLIQAGF